METLANLLWSLMGNPWFWIIVTIVIVAAFYFFRRTLRIIPFVVLILFGMVLGSLLPAFILQYHHELSGVTIGIEVSIEKLEIDMPSNDHSEAIEVLNTSLVYYQELLKKFDNVKGWEMYEVFFTNIQKRVYEETLERYSPSIVFNSYGFVGILIGAGIGFIFWILLKIFFRRIFRRKRKR